MQPGTLRSGSKQRHFSPTASSLFTAAVCGSASSPNGQVCLADSSPWSLSAFSLQPLVDLGPHFINLRPHFFSSQEIWRDRVTSFVAGGPGLEAGGGIPRHCELPAAWTGGSSWKELNAVGQSLRHASHFINTFYPPPPPPYHYY